MEIFFSLILTLAITAGQLVKVSIGPGGATLLDITVIIFCLFGLIQIKLKLLNPPLFIKAGLFFCFVALASLILTPLKLTLPQYFSSALYIVRFFSIILFGWLLLSKAFPKVRQNSGNILLLSGVSIAVLGLLQFIFLPDLRFLAFLGFDPHLYRTVSTFVDPNFAGAFFVLTLLLLFQNLGKDKKRIIYFLLVYLALLTTFSRSSYLMFLISFLVLALLRKSIKTAIFTMFLFVVLIFSFQHYIVGVNKITPLDRNQTAALRFSTWQQGLDIFQKNPLLGIGFNAYRFALEQYKLGDSQFLSSKGSSTNDASALYILATTGILGFIIYASFLIGLIKTKNLLLLAAIIGLLGHSIFVNSLFYPFIMIWLVLMGSSHDKQTIKS